MINYSLPALCLQVLLFVIFSSKLLSAQPLNNHLLFDGTDDYISLNNMDVSGNQITLEALINSSNLNNCTNDQCRIISKAVSPLPADHYWMLSTDNVGGNTVLRFRLKTNGTTTTLQANSGILSANTWYHVAATYDGTTMRLFLDGTQVGTTPKTGTMTTNAAAEVWIGGNPPKATGHPWQGEIDEVRIWNTARTQAEIQANKNSELLGNESGLQAYYQFNEGSGQTIADAAGTNSTILGSTSNADTNDPGFANPNPMTTFNLQVFLEGAYDAGQGSMTGSLLQRAVVPPGQPYTNSPWNYPGTEGNGWLPADYPVETVDWVLVSLRESLDPETEVARVAAVLLKDGTISSFDLNLNNSTNPLHVMIEHRNHLPIISAQPIPIINNTLSYDFTAQNSYSPSGFGQKQVGSNWMMYGGNSDQEGLNSCDINAADRAFWETVNGLFGVYNPGDYDLNGDVNGADRIVFNYNNGIFTTIPKSENPEVVLNCPTSSFLLDTCSYTFSWTHPNPASTVVNYDLRINGKDPGLSVTYPATSNTVDICNLLGITSGTGTIIVELIYWYDGDLSNFDTAQVCTIDYDITGSSTHGQGKTFAQIEADTDLPKFCSMDGDDAYVAEYLYQHPGVCYWNVVSLPTGEKCVVPVDVPTPPSTAIQLPAPSGGNDTQALEAVLNGNGTNKTFVGAGSYKVNQLDLDRSGTVIYNMNVTPASGAGELIHINANDIRLIDCPQDFQNQGSAYLGIRAQNADRFHLIRSGLTNMYHNGGNSGGGVIIKGCADFHIAGGTYRKIWNPVNGTNVCRANAFWITGWKSNGANEVTDGGYIVNNIGEDFQSTGLPANGNKDAEFITVQSHSAHLKQIKVFANRCVDAGKRLLKSQQDGGVTVLSNSYEWRTNSTVLGNRTRLAMIDVHLATGDVTARNNRLAINGNLNWSYVMSLQPYNKSGTNVHFDCNLIEINNPWNGQGYDQVVMAGRSLFSGSTGSDNSQESINCSMNDNTIFGTGGVNYNYWFGSGFDLNSGLLQPSGNTFNLGAGSPHQGIERK